MRRRRVASYEYVLRSESYEHNEQEEWAHTLRPRCGSTASSSTARGEVGGIKPFATVQAMHQGYLT